MMALSAIRTALLLTGFLDVEFLLRFHSGQERSSCPKGMGILYFLEVMLGEITGPFGKKEEE